MGILGRTRDRRLPWQPPAPGTCDCTEHVEDLLELNIPYRDWTGSVRVAEVLMRGCLTVVPTTPEWQIRYEPDGTRRGPFHWRLIDLTRLAPYVDSQAPLDLTTALNASPHFHRAEACGDDQILLGAPRLCLRGVQAALVRALVNPRLRQWEEFSESARRANLLTASAIPQQEGC